MTVKDIADTIGKEQKIELIFEGLRYPYDTGKEYPRKLYDRLTVAEIYANNNSLELVIAVTPKFN